MGLQFPNRCDGCPRVEVNNQAFDDASNHHEYELAETIQTETDRITANCELGRKSDLNREEFVCRTGELAMLGAETGDV